MSLRALCLVCLSFASGAWTVPATASCSRTITASYASPIAAVVYAALPERSLPSLVEGISRASGCKVEVVDLPTTRAWRNFDEGHLDIVLVAIRTDARDRLGDFVPGGRSPWVLVTRRGAVDPPHQIDDFNADRQLRLGVARGAAWPVEAANLMDHLRANGQIDESADFGMALTKLANGRDAAVLMIADAYVALMAASGDNRFQAIEQPRLVPSQLGTYLNRQTLLGQDLQALKGGLRKVHENGLADKLIRARVPQLATPESKPH